MEEGGVGIVWLPSCIGKPPVCAARAAVMLDMGLVLMAAISEAGRS